ncbi:MAG: hypothetical protein IKE74_09045 [Mogibacterium sp.]|nr:hypothetical protein [Mogibacterium sp.]
MKRFLSILLIAASLICLYGDYVNITDIFACKTYWEETTSKSEDELNALGAGLTKLKRNRKAYNKAVKQLARGRKSLKTAEAKYAATGSRVAALKSEYKDGVSAYKDLSSLIKEISNARSKYKVWKTVYDKLKTGRNTIVKTVNGPDPDKLSTVYDMLLVDIAVLISDSDEQKAFKNAVKSIVSNKKQTAAGYTKFASDCDWISKTADSLFTRELEYYKAANAVYPTGSGRTAKDLIAVLNSSQETFEAAVKLEMIYLVDEALARDFVGLAKEGDYETAKQIRTHAIAVKKESLASCVKLRWLRYYVTNNMKTYSVTAKKYAGKLKSVQNTIAGQVSSISSAVLGNSTYKSAVRRSMGMKAVALLEDYSKKPNKLHSSKTGFDGFEKQMDTKPGLNESLLKAQKLLYKKNLDVKKAVTAVKTKYSAYNRVYKAYPAKLRSAEAKLAKLEKSIAQYEDGEKQSKKGLKTLVNEKPDGDLESIKDRVGGNENFNDKKGNLDIDKGMEAVDAGEAYLNEAGDMITTELTGRAVGSAASIVAAVLGLLAALLSLFRSNRGGAMLACIAAVTAAGGTAMGMSADTVFSDLAGSTVGNLPWIAAMVLTGVAMVFAIVHFSAKIEDPLTDEEKLSSVK